MGKETAHEKEKAHEEHKDAHDTHQDAHQKPKDLDAQGKQAIKQTVAQEAHAKEGDHAKAGDHVEGSDHAGEHPALGPVEKALAFRLHVETGLSIKQCEALVGKLVHWSHTYSHAVHDYHLAMEGVETFLHILAEYGVSEKLAKFFHGAGGSWVTGILKGLAIPIVFAHATEEGNKAIAAFQSGNSTAGIYHSFQAVFQAGTMSTWPPLSWCCTFMSQMLQVSEGKGMVYEFATKMKSVADARRETVNSADVSFVNHSSVFQKVHNNLGGDGADRRSANLEFQSTGYASREDALKAIKDLRAQNTLQEDYAITQTGSVFTVHRLGSVNLFAADIDDQRELESVFLRDNKKNIVAVVAEDGSWGEVLGEDHEQRKRDGSVSKWRTFSVHTVGKL